MGIKTPFFKAFGPLLFGHAPGKAVAELQKIDSLEQLYGLFGELIPRKLLRASEKGVNSRDRSLPPRVTFWAFVAQVMNPGSSCRETVRKVEAWWRWAQKDRSGSLSASAYCQARARLDKATLALIGGQIALTLERHTLRAEHWLKGRTVKIVDGTTVSMPDTPENQSAWPQPTSQKPGLGFPQMKLAGLFSLASGALLDHATGDLHVHENQLFRQMWIRLSRGDIILADRGFCSYGALANLSRRGVDSVMRLHQARAIDFRKGRRLGEDDRLVIWERPPKPPTAFSPQEFDALPQTLVVRLIRLRVAAEGFRTRTVVVATTLLDPELYPADAIRALYAERWGVELHFHQIKTLMSLDILRCKSPDLIEKELLIHLIAYNLVRVLMQRSAHLHHVSLERISFKGSLDTARHFADVIHAASSSPRKQQRLIDDMLALIASDLLPGRPGRSEPRAKKRRPKNFQLLTKPRSQMGNLPHRNRPDQNRPKSALS
jgi:hypothetical protein